MKMVLGSGEKDQSEIVIEDKILFVYEVREC